MNTSNLSKSLVVLAGFLLAFAAPASAQIFSNVLSGASTGLPFAYFGNAADPSGDSPKVGEVFTVGSDVTLSSFSFYGVGNTTAASVQLNVAQWNPGTNVLNQAVNAPGAPLLTTTGSAAASYNATGGYTTLAFNNLGLNLSAGTEYIAYLTSSDPSLTHLQLSRTQTAQDASGFGKGFAYYSTIPDSGWQVPFNGNGFLSLQYTATASPIPEPSTYAALMGVATFGLAAVRRKRKMA